MSFGLNRGWDLPGFALAAGLFDDVTIKRILADAPHVESSWEVVWPYAVAAYNWYSEAVILGVSSADAKDTSAGVGARTVLIEGLDHNFDEQSETVTLTGQTKAVTVNKYYRVNRVKVMTAGTELDNAGVIYVYDTADTITAGVPDTATKVLQTITAGDNEGFAGIYTVPAGKTGYIIDITGGLGTYLAEEMEIGIEARPFGEVFRRIEHLAGSGAGMFPLPPLKLPVAITEKSDIQFRSKVKTGPLAMTCGITLVLINNE